MKVNTWFERDRAYVALQDDDENVIIELWDDDVSEAVEDGFLDMRDIEGSLRQYAKDLGLL